MPVCGDSIKWPLSEDRRDRGEERDRYSVCASEREKEKENVSFFF